MFTLRQLRNLEDWNPFLGSVGQAGSSSVRLAHVHSRGP